MIHPIPQHHYSRYTGNRGKQKKDRQQVVFTAGRTASCQDEIFIAMPLSDIERVTSYHLIFTSHERRLNFSPQLLEIWQACCTHPRDKMLILWINPLGSITVVCSSIFTSFVSWPCYACLIDAYLLSVARIELKSIVKESISYAPAWTSQGLWIQIHSSPTFGDLHIRVSHVRHTYFSIRFLNNVSRKL